MVQISPMITQLKYRVRATLPLDSPRASRLLVRLRAQPSPSRWPRSDAASAKLSRFLSLAIRRSPTACLPGGVCTLFTDAPQAVLKSPQLYS